jgi:DUF4097 and DUF4098 domain-containing protein YvlB
MNTLQFEAQEGLVLSLRQATGDTAIQGQDTDTILLTLDGDPDQCSVEQQENTLLVDSHVPLSITLPADTPVRVGEVSGDLLLRDLDGALSVESVHGDCSLRAGLATVSLGEVHGDLAVEDLDGSLSVGQAHADVLLTRIAEASLGQVHGDLHARTVDGDLKLGTVSGDVRVRQVSGALTLEEGRGSLHAQDLEGGMAVHAVRGDLSLRGTLAAGMTYQAQASGDVTARFPADASARFTLEAGGEVSASLPQVESEEAGRVVGQAGAGEAQVTLRAGGDLSLRLAGAGGAAGEEVAPDWSESLGEQIEAQIAAHLGELNLDHLVHHEVEKALHQAEQEIARAQQRIERETARAEERARRAQEKAARAAQRVQERMARRARKWGAPSGEGFFGRAEPARRAPKVPEEEQLAVLRMLQEGKISTEQAEQLLKALER